MIETSEGQIPVYPVHINNIKICGSILFEPSIVLVCAAWPEECWHGTEGFLVVFEIKCKAAAINVNV